jgi:hypothetical protein
MLVLSGLIAMWDWVRLGLVHSSPISHEAVTTFLTTHFGIIHGSASSGLVFLCSAVLALNTNSVQLEAILTLVNRVVEHTVAAQDETDFLMSHSLNSQLD